ncbi:unnamed protein product, partial [Symbiodinium necroappetens]
MGRAEQIVSAFEAGLRERGWQVSSKLWRTNPNCPATELPLLCLAADIASYSSIMAACSRAKQWQLSLKLFYTLEHLQAAPDLVCYGGALTACEGGRWQQAEELLRSMVSKSIQPDQGCFLAAARAFNASSSWQRAIEVF